MSGMMVRSKMTKTIRKTIFKRTAVLARHPYSNHGTYIYSNYRPNQHQRKIYQDREAQGKPAQTPKSTHEHEFY